MMTYRRLQGSPGGALPIGAALRAHPGLRATPWGAALFSAVLLSLPLSSLNLAQLQALNRELGKLCNSPPREALTVCRLHARLVSAL